MAVKSKPNNTKTTTVNTRPFLKWAGNKYRIIVLTDYARHGILIRFVGTHKQYDEIKDIDNI